MAGKHDIYVYDDGGVFYVRPPVAVVDGGHGRLKVRNLTPHPITLRFPPGVVRGNSFDAPRHSAVEEPLERGADGIYDYSVEVRLTAKLRAKALGNSWPKIIVDP